MPSARTCAFCNEARPLTREHIWPKCIIDRVPTYNARYIGAHQKFVEAELTVRDVCSSCNNGPLSQLDAYACGLFDAQFVRIAEARKARTFIYDYTRLLRWLLKLSYNAARANRSDVDRLAQYSRFVLHGGTPPSDVELRLELVRPSKNPKHIVGSGSREHIPPESVRCSRAILPNCPVEGVVLRLVAVNSFYFWLALLPKDVTPESMAQYLPGTDLPATRSRLTLFPGAGMLERHQDWVLDPRSQQSMRAFRARNDG